MTEDQLDDIIEDIMTSTWESGKVKIINLCKQMCDKQVQICYENIRILKEDYYDQGDKLGPAYLDEEKFLNSPYPEELQ